MSFTHLQSQAEDLKCELWHFIEKNKIESKIAKDIKDTTNHLLDLIDYLEDLDGRNAEQTQNQEKT